MGEIEEDVVSLPRPHCDVVAVDRRIAVPLVASDHFELHGRKGGLRHVEEEGEPKAVRGANHSEPVHAWLDVEVGPDLGSREKEEGRFCKRKVQHVAVVALQGSVCVTRSHSSTLIEER